MDITEVKRRIAILEKEKVVTINKRMLRGGMDYRTKRRNIDGYNKTLNKTKKTYSNRLLQMEAEQSLPKDISISSFSVPEADEDFILPKLKKTRIGGRGWY